MARACRPVQFHAYRLPPVHLLFMKQHPNSPSESPVRLARAHIYYMHDLKVRARRTDSVGPSKIFVINIPHVTNALRPIRDGSGYIRPMSYLC